MAAQWIVWLDEIEDNQIAFVEGKAANLGRILSLGLNVPAGFCLTTTAYRRFVESNHLADRIDALVRDMGKTVDPFTLFSCPMGEELEREILTSARRLLDTLPAGSGLAARR